MSEGMLEKCVNELHEESDEPYWILYERKRRANLMCFLKDVLNDMGVLGFMKKCK